MEIKINKVKYNQSYQQRGKTAFKGLNNVKTLKQCKIGTMKDGFLGKVKVYKGNGKECFLDIIKNSNGLNEEIYRLIDDNGNIIGQMCIRIKKFIGYKQYSFAQDPSHVFVDELRNFSNPSTSYFCKDLEEYKSVGIRLLQIALKRSEESMCNGNLELITKNESQLFYEKLGFMVPPNLGKFDNHNRRYLPNESKIFLSNLKGGL